MKKRVFAGALIILAGVLITVYPWLKAAYFEYNKNKALNQWEQMTALRGAEKIQETPGGFSNAAEPDNSSMSDEQLDEEVWEEDTSALFNVEYVLANMAGTIKIDKIHLFYPILHGATKYNLNLTICTVAGSPEMGEEGNYCLAGHKSRIYGRQFNRLAELQKGDVVSLSDGVNSYDYVVVKTMQVSAEDTWVLDSVEGKKVLTLITCDYTVKPIGRFIVKCEPAA